MGSIEVKDIPIDIYDPADGDELPACFDPDQLTPFSVANTAHWDETHKKQKVGKV